MDTGANVMMGNFEIGKPSSILKNKQAGGANGSDLTELFDKMQIAVVGRENNEADSGISEDGDSDQDEDDDEDDEQY